MTFKDAIDHVLDVCVRNDDGSLTLGSADVELLEQVRNNANSNPQKNMPTGNDSLEELYKLPLDEYLRAREKLQRAQLEVLEIHGNPAAEAFIESMWTRHWYDHRIATFRDMALAVQAVIELSDAQSKAGDHYLTLSHKGYYMRRFRELLDAYQGGE